MERKAEAAGSWWDTLGKPQYGGEMVIRSTANIANFDPYYSDHIIQIYTAWTEKLYAKNWLLNRAIFDHKVLLPPQFLNGQVLMLSIYAKESTGKTFRRLTDASLLLMTSYFTITGFTVWAAVL